MHCINIKLEFLNKIILRRFKEKHNYASLRNTKLRFLDTIEEVTTTILKEFKEESNNDSIKIYEKYEIMDIRSMEISEGIYYHQMDKLKNAFQAFDNFYTINAADINLENIFHIVKRKLPAPMIYKKSHSLIKSVIFEEDRNDFNRVLQKITYHKKLTFDDLNKEKHIIKIKGNRKNTKNIEGLKQAVYRSMLKPIEILSVVTPMVIVIFLFKNNSGRLQCLFILFVTLDYSSIVK